MTRARLVSALIAVALPTALVAGAGPSDAFGSAAGHSWAHRSVLSVEGDVAAPQRYSLADLSSLDQLTLPDLRSTRGNRQRTVTGVSLDGLVAAAQPRLSDVKNASLRVTVTVVGRNERAAFALGELDADFGNHPALLVLPAHGGRPSHGLRLAVPGDSGYARNVRDVSRVKITVANPSVPADVSPGNLEISNGPRVITVSAGRLARLPQQTRTVSFTAGTGQQQHTESGPTLADVLRAAHVHSGAATSVAAVGSDGYVAAVTPREATSGRRPLLVSLLEDGAPLELPRLVVDGDLKGGRYVSDLEALVVTGGCPSQTGH